jgi:hypothetical protein
MKFTAWVPIEDEEPVEGNFYAGESPEGYSTKMIAEVCPFCDAPLELVSAPVFGRIVQDTGTRNPAGEALAVIERMPTTHEALSCSECGMVMTRLKEGAAV